MSYKYKHAAIPTTYKGVLFRSRLEARWAAFFDLLAWPWEYEPFDFSGYIPDFFIDFKEPWIIEVKPFTSLDSDSLIDTKAKIERSGITGRYGIFGSRLNDLFEYGWPGAPMPHSPRRNLLDGSTACGGLCCDDFDGAYRDSLYPCPFGWCYDCQRVFPDSFCEIDEHHDVRWCSLRWIEGHWYEAGNVVQWSGKR